MKTSTRDCVKGSAALGLVVWGATIGLAPPAVAQTDAAADRFIIPWTITPLSEGPGALKTVKPRTTIASALLVPEKAFAVTDDVLDERGNRLFGGKTLLAVAESQRIVACTYRVSSERAAAFVAFGGEKYLCLVDADRDGRFESYFSASSAFAGVLVGSLKIPKVLRPLKPVRYSADDVAQDSANPRIHVQYSLGGGISGRLVFDVCFTENTNVPRECLQGSEVVHAAALPAGFEIFGAAFVVESKLGNSISVRMTRPFVKQPLKVFIGEPRIG